MEKDRDVAIAGATALGILCLIGFAGYHAGERHARAEPAALCTIDESDGDVNGVDAYGDVSSVRVGDTIYSVRNRVPCKWLKRYANT